MTAFRASEGRSADQDRAASAIFTHAAFFGSIVLQRFCVFIGAAPLFLCLPIFLAAVGWMLLSGRGTLRPAQTLLLCAFALVGLLSTWLAIDRPDPRVGLSIGSFATILTIYAGLTVRPTGAFDGRQVFKTFVIYVRICSALGILQYLLQFAGIRLFSFMLLVPRLKPFLVEPLFNFNPVLSYGSSILRSNGFFLVEPSTFSQLILLGLVTDVLIRRRWHFVPLYALAQLLTYSGTGLLALAITLPLVILIDFRRSQRLLVFLLALLAGGGIAAVLLPDQVNALLGRTNELSYSGSSGYARYVAPLQMIQAVWGETRSLIGYGPGAMERADFYVPGGGSAAAKIFIDYGIAGLIVFATFIVSALWRRDIAIVSVYGLVNFQLGGGFLLFPPFVVILAALCIWADPVRDRQALLTDQRFAPPLATPEGAAHFSTWIRSRDGR